MDYDGAADYFFWKGVWFGQIGSRRDLNSMMSPLVNLNTPTHRACSKAFSWGIDFGLVINPEDYIKLTTVQEPVRVKKKAKKVKKKKELMVIDTIDRDYPIKGNC